MLIPSDKELDRLSREAAEQYEPDESISSWEKLEARLDTELGKPTVPSARRFGRGPIGYTAIILLITGGGKASIDAAITRRLYNKEKTAGKVIA